MYKAAEQNRARPSQKAAQLDRHTISRRNRSGSVDSTVLRCRRLLRLLSSADFFHRRHPRTGQTEVLDLCGISDAVQVKDREESAPC